MTREERFDELSWAPLLLAHRRRATLSCLGLTALARTSIRNSLNATWHLKTHESGDDEALAPRTRNRRR